MVDAQAAGIRNLASTYCPMVCNKIVVDYYARIGFTKMGEDESGLTRLELFVECEEPEGAHMRVVLQGFTAARKTLKSPAMPAPIQPVDLFRSSARQSPSFQRLPRERGR